MFGHCSSAKLPVYYILKSMHSSSRMSILVLSHRYSLRTLTFFSSIAFSRKFRSLLDSGVSLILFHSLSVDVQYFVHD